MQKGTVGIKVRRRWSWSFFIISLLAVGSTMLCSKCEDHRPDRIHYHRRMEDFDLMMGVTQEMVRDRNAPMSFHLLYSGDVEIFHDEFNPKMTRIVYLSFVLLSSVLLRGPIFTPVACTVSAFLPNGP